jgi:hypothetical protein
MILQINYIFLHWFLVMHARLPARTPACPHARPPARARTHTHTHTMKSFSENVDIKRI